MFTGSLTENRVNIGIPAIVRQELYDEARLLGMPIPDIIRHILLSWREDRLAARRDCLK